MNVERSSSWLALAILGVFIIAVLSAGAQKSETVDEGLFIAGGAAQVEHLEPNIDLTHPPLLRWISGLSAVLFGRARAPEPSPVTPGASMDLFGYKLDDIFGYGVRFFYNASNSHDRVLFWGRFPFAFIGALLGWLVFAESRRLLGPGPGLVALALFAFTPEVLAHAEWAHSDLASALTIWLVAIFLARALASPSWRADLLLGGAMGLAVATKLTALTLWPLVLILVAVWTRGLSAFIKRAAVMLAIFYVVLVAAYFPQPRLTIPHEFERADLAHLGIEGLAPVLQRVPLPDSFLKGVVYTILLGKRGQVSFFHGEVKTTGWWYYFPAAIFLKYPTGLLIVAITGLVALWSRQWPWSYRLAMTVPPLAILASAMMQSVDVGARSVLPMAPFLALWGAASIGLSRSSLGRSITVLLIATSILSGIAAYPDFLTYFNPLLGGTASAHRWLVDANLDWGQDLPALAKELQRRQITEVRLAYFGMAEPSHYGIKALPADVVAPGWYAISRSYLSGWWPPGDPYRWLRGLQPVTLAGGSIALYQISDAQAQEGRAMDKPQRSEEMLMQAGLDALYRSNNPAQAAELFRAVLERNPTHYGAHFQLARALDSEGKPDQARPLWEKVLAMAVSYRDESTIQIARARLAR
jgi:hypothetical protein